MGTSYTWVMKKILTLAILHVFQYRPTQYSVCTHMVFNSAAIIISVSVIKLDTNGVTL